MNQLNGYGVKDLHVGMCASFSKTITEADLVLFAGVSGDSNAMHEAPERKEAKRSVCSFDVQAVDIVHRRRSIVAKTFKVSAP
jgi:acyl dehydratase